MFQHLTIAWAHQDVTLGAEVQMKQLGLSFDDGGVTPNVVLEPAVQAQLVTLMAQSLLAVLDQNMEKKLGGDDDDRLSDKQQDQTTAPCP